MEPSERTEGGGKKELAHSRAAQTAVHGFGDKDIHLFHRSYFGCTWPLCPGHARYGPMGRPGPGGEKYHQVNRGSNDGVTKKKTKKEDCRTKKETGW
jgi:hypothetical protein